MSVNTTFGTLAGKLLVLLGEALQAAGRRGAATACFQRATQQDGQLATAWGSLARISTAFARVQPAGR